MTEEHISINYWKEIMGEMKPTLEHIKELLLLIHNSAEFDQLIDFFNLLPHSEKIVYISLTKTYNSVQPFFSKIHSTVFMIDCVSKGLFDKEDTTDCYFEHTPESLQEILSYVIETNNQFHPNYIIIDSLSQFIDFTSLHDQEESVSHFTQKLRSFLQTAFCKVILLYDHNVSKCLATLPKQSIANILRMEVSKEEVHWHN